MNNLKMFVNGIGNSPLKGTLIYDPNAINCTFISFTDIDWKYKTHDAGYIFNIMVAINHSYEAN